MDPDFSTTPSTQSNPAALTAFNDGTNNTADSPSVNVESAFTNDPQTAVITGLLGIAVISIDSSQIITAFDDAASTIFGYSPHEIIGQPVDLLMPERMRKRHQAHVEFFRDGNSETRRMDERLETDIIGRRKDGTEFPAEATISI